MRHATREIGLEDEVEARPFQRATFADSVQILIMSENRRQMRSDPPVEDLKRERDAFIQQFFRRGAQISEELLGEMERLREQVSQLEAENVKLKAHVASDDAIKNLLRKIEELEAEKDELITRSVKSIAPPSEEIAARFAAVETELANLGTLHVAGIQLRNATSIRRALRNIKELCAQFLGAAQTGIYWATDDRTGLVAISVDGLTAKDARQLGVEDTRVGQAFATGDIYFTSDDPSRGTVDNPACVVPMTMAGTTLGAIAVFRTLPQKTSFDGVDYELFKLLAAQAAPVLVYARLFSDADRRAPSVQAFIDQED